MEGSQFDDVVGSSRPRRGERAGLQGLAGVLMGGLGHSVVGNGVDAKHKRGRTTKQRRDARAQSNPKSCDVGCANLKAQAKTACRTACKECNGDFGRICVGLSFSAIQQGLPAVRRTTSASRMSGFAVPTTRSRALDRTFRPAAMREHL